MNPGRHVFLVMAVLAVLAGVSACSTSPTKTSEQRYNDEQTVAAVEGALKADTHIYSQHIIVQVDNGVVHLSGYVWNDFDQYEAARVAETVPGVSKVVDEMELERNGIDNSPVSR